MDKKEKKGTIYVKDGKTRLFTDAEINVYGDPSREGWVKQTGEVAQATEKSSKEPIGGNGEVPKSSKEMKTSQQSEIIAMLTGKTAEEINAFFDGEQRVTLTDLRDSLIAAIEKGEDQ